MTHLFALPVAIVLCTCGLLFDVAAQPGLNELRVLVLATIACVSAFLFAPIRNPGERDWFIKTLLDAVLVAAIFAISVFAILGNIIELASLIRVAAICVLLILSGMSFLAIARVDRDDSRQYLVVMFLALLAAPVWLAPVAELSGNSIGITNAIVAISPLSAFAVALDVDYLRTSWFYEHSVLGSLRYSYPSWLHYVTSFSILTILTIFPGILMQRRRAKL